MRPGSKIDSERDCFEIDRSVLIGQVKALKLTIRNALTEIEMIAAENVFDKPLSAKLKRKARALNRMAQRLDVLGNVLTRAKFPGVKK
ncbi:MAG: hypothetical protein WCA22_00370 [Candidatus Binatus sp.]